MLSLPYLFCENRSPIGLRNQSFKGGRFLLCLLIIIGIVERSQSINKNMNRPITPKQNRCLEWVAEYIRDRGFSPSIRDIAVGLGYKSISTPQVLLKYLKDAELIGWVEGKPRSLYIIETATPVVKVSPAIAEVKIELSIAIALSEAKQRWDDEGLDFGKELQRRLVS